MKKAISRLLVTTLLLSSLCLASCGGSGGEVSETPGEQSGVTSQAETSEASEDIPVDKGNIAYGCPYFYDCGITITGDNTATVLTDGKNDASVTLAHAFDKDGKGYELSFVDWNSSPRKEKLVNDCAAISVDLGFMADVTKFAVTFEQYSGKECEIFYSTDGYNYSFYAGKMGEYSGNVLSVDIAFTAKGIMFVFPLDAGEEIKISDIAVYGTKSAEKILVSKGAKYSYDGKGSTKYPDENGTKLTDGVSFDGVSEDTITVINGSVKDDLTGKTGAVLTLDLGEIKNVSELYVKAYRPARTSVTLPDKIDVRYSSDGENWTDFGQSFLRSTDGQKGSACNVYCVTRNHTVKARYIRIYDYISGTFLTDEVYVYGAENEVSEPDYGFINRKNQFSNSNVAAFSKASLNGTDSKTLVDMTFSSSVKCADGRNTLEITASSECKAICGVTLTGKKCTADNVVVKVDGKEATGITTYKTEVGSETNFNIYFDALPGSKVTVEFDSDTKTSLTEVSIYEGRAQLPIVRGGFFQMPTGGNGGGASSENSDYSWYLMLKGMKDLGMDYVVMQYTANFNAKTTLVNGENALKAGFRYVGGYGSADVYEAILTAADKLGMEVYLGTIHDSDFNSPITNKPFYYDIVEASKPVIKDIYEKYSHHESFAGYYLSDEECDQWLNYNGGVEAGRIVYKGQSDYIHEIAPDAKVMIAPAIWRSGDAVKGADNLYRLIAPDNDGERPVVDIVAAQDCLGRTSELTVPKNTYDSFNTYCTEWAKAVRRAGAEFWHDAEVFEQIYTSKRYDELVKTLGIEAKLSGTIIVFDIPHYFTQYPVTPVNNEKAYYKTRIMRDYIRYYSTFASLDKAGDDADSPVVINDDGRVVERSNGNQNVDPVKHDTKYNEGFLKKKTITINDVTSLDYKAFQAGNKAGTPEFALCYDDNDLYIVIKTNDETASYGKGQWWEGKDDLVQIWMTADGTTVGDVSQSDYGIRFYAHRQSKGWANGGEGSDKIKLDLFNVESVDDYVLVTVPFDAIGIKTPESGNGGAIGVKIQYIDGADSTWASTNGSNDRSVPSTSLFSY